MSEEGVPAVGSNPTPAPPGVTIVPTMEVWGPAGRVVINTSDKEEWLSRGFTEVPPPAPSTGGEGGGG